MAGSSTVLIMFFFMALGCLAINISPSDEAEFFAGMGSQRMTVLIISRLGLANRLRAVADWYQIATISNRMLLVSWEPTVDCNAKFTDLFIDGPPNFKIMHEHVPRDDLGVKHIADIAANLNISHRAIYENDMSQLWVNGRGRFILSKDVVFDDTDVVITHYDGAVSLEGVACQQYLLLHSQFLSRLVPNEDAQKFLNSLHNDLFVNRIMVGVHYRAHDNQQDWAVVPPASGNEATNFGTRTSVQDFLSVMSAIQNKFTYTDRNGVLRTHVRFFVASNNETVKAMFQAVVKDGVFLGGEHRRDTINGMQIALLEWLALSQSSLLINTYGSSFAEQAALVHMRPLVGLWDGNLVHHLSVHLPYCGHLQFVKAFSKQGHVSAYTEGTADRREV